MALLGFITPISPEEKVEKCQFSQLCPQEPSQSMHHIAELASALAMQW
jgi:hypothetical protein